MVLCIVLGYNIMYSIKSLFCYMASSLDFQLDGTILSVKYDRNPNKSIINCSAPISLTNLNLKSEICNFAMKDLKHWNNRV